MLPTPESSASNRRPTTVLFDLDDTLFDHAATARAALHLSASPLPFFAAVEFEGFYQHYSDLLKEYHAGFLAGHYSHEEARRLRFQRLLAPFWPAATARRRSSAPTKPTTRGCASRWRARWHCCKP